MRDTIEMAREAGGCEYGNANPDIESTFILKDDQIKAFEALVRAEEREACAKVCDDINAKYKWPDDVAERVASQWCADAIRARGETK
jgi:hypothetical protein